MASNESLEKNPRSMENLRTDCPSCFLNPESTQVEFVRFGGVLFVCLCLVFFFVLFYFSFSYGSFLVDWLIFPQKTYPSFCQ